MLTFAERVANGVALLDEKTPEWRTSVEPETLVMDSPNDCILGQVYGDWLLATEGLAITGHRDRQEFYGFEFTVDEYLRQDFPSFRDELRSEWIKQL